MRASLLKNGVLGLAGVACSALGNLALALAAAHALGASGSGLLFASVAIFTVVTNAAKAGADTGLVKFVSRCVAGGREDRVPRLLRIALPTPLVAGLVCGGVMVLAAPWLAQAFYPHGALHTATQSLRLMSPFVPIGALTLVMLGATRGYGTVTPFVAVEQVLKPALRPPLILLVMALGGGVLMALASWLAPVAVGAVLAVVYLWRQVRAPRPLSSEPFIDTTPREFWTFSASRALGGFLEVTNTWVSVIILSSLSNSADAGIFTAAARIAMVGTLVMVATRLALGAHVSAAFAAGDLDGIAQMHLRSTLATLIVCWPFFILAAVFAAPLLGLFGAGFTAGAAALTAVALGNLVNAAVGNAQTIVLMAGRASWNAMAAGAAVVTQVVLGVILVPSTGVVGAGIALGVSIVVSNVIAYAQVRFGLGIPIWSRSLTSACAWVILVFGASSLAGRLVFGDSLAGLVLASAIGTLLSLGQLRNVVRLLRDGLEPRADAAAEEQVDKVGRRSDGRA
jgi:O-antigen/teichoic acid export membrane protein